jgi:uncharacterized repeat protein (TIGR01451 family)
MPTTASRCTAEVMHDPLARADDAASHREERRMDTRAPTPHCTNATSRLSAMRLLLSAALLASLVPIGSVHAQSYPNSLSNTVTVTLPPTVTDPQTGNNTATDINTLAAEAALTLDKTLLTPSPVLTGNPVTYRILVTNAGPSAALGANIADTVPTQLANVSWACTASAGSSCSVASGTGDVSVIANIAAAGSIIIDVTGTAPLTTPSTVGANTATVTLPPGTTDPDPGDNTDTTPPIPVIPRPIDAVPDNAGPVDGGPGQTNVVNVLANDTFNGAPATLAALTYTPAGAPPLTLNLDGSVDVAAGTPTGVYTANYEICETANPGNCDTTTVAVTVNATATIDAIDDALQPQAEGNIALSANVLDNDLLNGAPAAGLVTLTSPNTGVLVIAADGTVTLSPATTAGTYSTTYQICETTSPSNCDSATVTVRVLPPIDAVDDGFGPIDGTTGSTNAGNVLANDTAGLATPPSLTGVSLTGASTAAIIFNADGSVTVPPGTPAGPYTTTYTICYLDAPTVCDTATVQVATVVAGVLVANDDAFGPINGTAGSPNAGNVLANDTLNGSPVNPAAVTLTPTGAGNVIIATDGIVSVAPNTPAGTYTPSYQICENAAPANCDTATATVTVATIDAVNDTFGPSQPGTSAGNVLANDFANGVAAMPASVMLTQTSGTPALTIAANGDASIAPGAPAGTLNASYQICLVSSPAICDTATVAVTVATGNLIANDDAFGPVDGTAGNPNAGNVLANDTLNGSPVVASDVTLTPTNAGTVTIATDGTVSVAPNTPAGTYTPSYQICENLNPSNCDTATVTVTVATVDAVNDTFGPSQPDTSAGNVLANDLANGVAATPAAVTLTQTSGTPALTIAANGDASIAPGTPAGTINADYQICLASTPTICDGATIAVTVAASNLIANDDAFGPIDGTAGNPNTGNVLANDTFNGSPVNPADVTLTPTSAGTVTIATDGTVAVAPNTPAGTYTPSYQICENLNPSNCDTATVTVTVATVDAADDSLTLADGVTGGVAGNVLDNDLSNGGQATPGNVSLSGSFASPLSLASNGDVLVAPNTPAGTYTASYTICAQSAPAICDGAAVTVTVSTLADPIAANADSGSANGRNGGTAVASVLSNDSLSGSAPTTATVTLTLVTASTHPGITLDTGSGAVNVTPATPTGSGTLRYRICEQADPANCAEADVAITVTAAVIDAVNDTAGPINGRTGGNAVLNVLANDTLDGTAVNPADVALTVLASDPPITLNPNGTMDVAADTAAGSYTATYRLCETLNPGNCDQATATIVVSAAAIDAIDDTAPAAVSSVTGGQAVADVTGNDLLDGAPVALAQVTLAQVSSTHANVQLDTGSGAVAVAPRTPAGSYTLTYRLCERLNPSNCDNAVVTLTVGLPPVDAQDDTPAPVPGGNAVTGIVNVLTNDRYNGGATSLADVSLAPVTQPPLTLNDDGTVDLAGGTPGGTYTLSYSLCDRVNPSNCDGAVVTVTVNATTITAGDDAAQTPQGVPVSIAVLANDTYAGEPAGNGFVQVQAQTAPTRGTVAYPADGTATYTPGQYFSGNDSFQYRVCERAAPMNCSVATVMVTVQANTVTALDDRVRTYDVAVTVQVLANDVAASAPLDPASLHLATAPSHGQATCGQGNCVYTPQAGFVGQDRFDYRVCDVSVPTPVCAQASVLVDVQAEPPALRLSKTAAQRTAKIGDLVRYTLRIDNVGSIDAVQVSLFDHMPEGFVLAPGSLQVGDDDTGGALAQQRPMRVDGLDIAVGRSATISYVLRVGAGTGPGVHTNRAIVRDTAGTALSNEATADVEIIGDPLLQDSLILGSVFDDRNGNGRQDAGERGLPGVRLGSVEGLVIETDRHGRFHLTGIDGGRWARGRNFLLKVDVTSLPPGSRFTTENPRVLRITPGIPVRFDFGVNVPVTQIDGTRTDDMLGGDGGQDAEAGDGRTGARASPDHDRDRRRPISDTVTRALPAWLSPDSRACPWSEARSLARVTPGSGGR